MKIRAVRLLMPIFSVLARLGETEQYCLAGRDLMAQLARRVASVHVVLTACLLLLAGCTAEPSSNADLSGLTLSEGTLVPMFQSGIDNYTATVGSNTESLTVKPEAAASAATITVNGVAVASGSASAPLPLVEGLNTTTVAVTAEDGTTVKNYTVEVTRQAGSADLAGQWRVTESLGDNDCRDSGVDLDEVSVTQLGLMLTFELSAGGSMTGMLEDRNISVSGSFPDDTGTTMVDNAVLTVSPDGNTVTGPFSWTWFDDADTCSGASTLYANRIATDSGFSIYYARLIFRTYEGNSRPDDYRGVVAVMKDGRGIVQNDISSVFLRDQSGTAVLPAPSPPTLFTDHYLFLDWNDTAAAFTQEVIPDDSYYWFVLDNHSDFPAGAYTFEVNPVTGPRVEQTVQFPGPQPTTAVAGASIVATWLAPRGDLQITWPVTTDVDQYRIGLHDNNKTEYIFARVPGGVNDVVVSRSAIDWLEAKSSINPFETDELELRFHTRTYVNDTNVSRHISSSQMLTKPSRGSGGWTYGDVSDDFFRNNGTGCGAAVTDPPVVNCTKRFAGFSSQISVDYGWTGPEPTSFPDASFTLTDLNSGQEYSGVGTLTVEKNFNTALKNGEEFDRVTFEFEATPIGGSAQISVVGDVTYTDAGGGGGGPVGPLPTPPQNGTTSGE